MPIAPHPGTALRPLPVERIMVHLSTVSQLRDARAADAGLAARVLALKTYQAARFELTYADLLASDRYQAAARFFLNELYGPQEFSRRDAQFVRIVPTLVRMFPAELVQTLELLGQLHALTESLDDAAARTLPRLPPDAPAYAAGWQAVARSEAREQQIALTLQIGASLDHYTRKPLLRASLKLMRKPAQRAGLAELQQFLQTGFDAFGAMAGAADFLRWVGERERALAAALFAPGAVTGAALPRGQRPAPLAQLP